MKILHIFDWRTIRNLAESKAFLLFNALLVAVPFIVRIGLAPAFDTFLLYLAAFALVVCSLLYVVFIPEVMKYDLLSRFRDAGKTPAYLKASYEKYVDSISTIKDEHVFTKLDNRHGASDVDSKTFEFVLDSVNKSNYKMRVLVSVVYYLAFLLMAIAYVYRLVMVVWAFVDN